MRHERAGVVGTSSVWMVGPDRLVRGVGSAGLGTRFGTRSCPSRTGRDLGSREAACASFSAWLPSAQQRSCLRDHPPDGNVPPRPRAGAV